MAKTINDAKASTHKEINISINKNDELEITGKNKGNKGFQQTIPVNPPCLLFWDDKIDNFVVFKIEGEIPENYELVKTILSIKDI